MVELRVVDDDLAMTDATVIAGLMTGRDPAPGSEAILEGADLSLIEISGFEGKSGETMTIPHDDASAVLLVGLGDEASFESVRAASGNAIRKVKTARAVSLLGKVGVDGVTRAVAEGSILGGYQFRTYKTDNDALDVEVLEIVDGDPEELKTSVVAAEATNLARDWVNTPAKDKSPQQLASLMGDVAKDAGIDVEIWDRSRIEDEELGALLGVAAGSDRDPRLVTLAYRPEGAEAHVALVGKGIVFDSGGLSIKSSTFMEEMKDDMSGAAIVVAATIAIAQLGLPVKVTTIAPLTDNVIGGNATRPGDVLKPVEGPSIEVLNTDAEGRLILADGLGLARRHNPDLIVDVATLTGAARVALGDKVAAVFGSRSETVSDLLKAASRAGEHFWELPLFKDYRQSIDSTVADIKNISGTRYGGAIVAALFLSEYVGDGPWLHLDVAGPAMARETSGEHVKGASGVGVRTLVEFIRAVGEEL